MVSVGHIRGTRGEGTQLAQDGRATEPRVYTIYSTGFITVFQYKARGCVTWRSDSRPGWWDGESCPHNAGQCPCPSLACQGITPVNHLHSSTETKFIIHPACIWTGLAGKTTIVNSFALILLFEKIYGLGSFRRKPKQNNRNVDKKNKPGNPSLFSTLLISQHSQIWDYSTAVSLCHTNTENQTKNVIPRINFVDQKVFQDWWFDENPSHSAYREHPPPSVMNQSVIVTNVTNMSRCFLSQLAAPHPSL